MTTAGPFIHIHSLESSKLGDGLEQGLGPSALRDLSVRAIFLATAEDIVVVDKAPDPAWIDSIKHIGIQLPTIYIPNGTGETLVEMITQDHKLCSTLSESGFPIKPYMGGQQIQTLAHQLSLKLLAPEAELLDQLNHKSNLDQILQEIGLPRIPTQVSTKAHIVADARSGFEDLGPLMIRSDLSIGGHGVWRIESHADLVHLETGIQAASDGRKFIWQPLKSVTNSPNVQFEIDDDTCTMLGVSAQQMTESFAFGGNDYPSELSRSAELIEQSTRTAQRLQAQGYRGFVGLDFIVTTDQRIYIVEINPRVNTSSFPLMLSNRLAIPAFKLMTGIRVNPEEIGEFLRPTSAELYSTDTNSGFIPLMPLTTTRPLLDAMVFADSLAFAQSIADRVLSSALISDAMENHP
jgi:ATP-grasp domain